MRRLILAISLIAGAHSPAAADCVDYREYRHWAGGYPLPSLCWEQVVGNGRAYATARNSGLFILDVTVPSSVTLMATLDTPGSAWAVRKTGDHLLVADASNGLLTVDVSNPAAPAIVNTWDPGFVRSVQMEGNIAYAAGMGQFHVLDITDVTAPVPIGSVAIAGDTYDIALNGTQAVLAANDGLYIMDVSDAAHPTQSGFLARSWPGWGHYWSVVARGDYAYVVAPSVFWEYGALEVVDISDPAMPTVVNSTWYYGGVFDVALDGSELVLAESFGVSTYDLSNPALPQDIEVLSQEPGFGLTIADGFLYCLSYDLEIVDLRGPAVPPVLATSPLGEVDIGISGDYAYVTSASPGRLDVIDISSPGSLPHVAMVPASSPGRLDVQGNFLYVSSNGLTIFDISAPASPAVRGSLGSITVVDLEVQGDYAYTIGGGKLSVVDVSNPLAPVLVRQEPLDQYATRLALSGSRLCVAREYDGIQFFELISPDMPVSRAVIDTPDWAYDVEIEGYTAFVADGGTLRAYDITDPSSPLLLAALTTAYSITGVTREGQFLYVGDYGEGVTIIDVSNPASPAVVGSHRGVEAVWELAVSGDLVYVCTEYDGLAVIEPQCAIQSEVPAEPVEPGLLFVGRPWPNPTRAAVRLDFEIPAGALSAGIDVFDVLGRRLRSLTIDPAEFGHRSTLTWDGTDESGADIPAGIYFMRVTSDGGAQVRRIVRHP